ncbi:MAG TPA: RHS repeat-associated core domain-containing protein [Solirubrobacteraceae bacterium]|nr:RHS repeat-associated core domain-containing protein [Solirubrobacteraceae bacterium]
MCAIGLLVLLLGALGVVGFASAQTGGSQAQPPAATTAATPADPATATRYAGLTDAGAWDLARQVLPQGLPLPVGSGLQTDPGVARAAAVTTAKKPAKQRIEYLGERSALMTPEKKGARSTIVESTTPLQSKGPDGKLRPLDLNLRTKGSGYLAPVNAGTDVLVSRRLDRWSLLPEVGVKVRPIVPRGGRVTARQAATAFFANVGASTDVSMSAEPGGLQAMWVLRSPSSPSALTLAFDAPQLKLTKRPAGDVLLRGAKGKRLAVVRAPVAWDARGRMVRVTTKVVGKRLRYAVAHRGRELDYPIVVDPVTETYNWASSTVTTGWTARLPSPVNGHSSSFVSGSGLRLGFAGTAGTASSAEWYYAAPAGATITSFTAGVTTLTSSTPAGTNCVVLGLRQADVNTTTRGATIDPSGTPAPKCTTPVASATYASPAGPSPAPNLGNVAYFKLQPQSTSTSATATLASATLTFADSGLPTLGTPSLTSTTARFRALPWVGLEPETLVVAASDAGLGAKTVQLKDPSGAVVDTKTHPCTGVQISKCPATWSGVSWSPALAFQTGRVAPAVPQTYKLVATDLAGNVTEQNVTIRHDRDLPDIEFDGSLATAPIGNSAKQLTINASDSWPGATAPADQQSGVRSIAVKLDGVLQGSETVAASCAHSCPLTRTYDLDLNALSHGSHTVEAIATDFAGNVQRKSLRVVADKRGPQVTLSGPLKDAAGTTLTKETYGLHVEARDGTADAEPESGATEIELVWTDTATGVWRQIDHTWRDCATDSCAQELDFAFDTRRFPANGLLEAKAKDKLGNLTTVQLPLTPGATPTYETTALSGLEQYLQFDSVEAGAGSRAHVNQTTGNLVWNHVPLVNPGRGLSTFANVTYNSQVRTTGPDAGYKEIGENFSLGISGITRVNEPLDVAQADAATDPRVTLVDADSTRHVFRKNASGLYYDAPAGVQLHLRRYSSAYDRTWAVTRPDGITHFFDQRGFPTYIEDRNQDILRFEYEIVKLNPAATCPVWGLSVSAFSAADCRQRLVAVTDSAGVREGVPNRSVRLAYASAAGPITSITDHGGRVLSFGYLGDRLVSLTEADGTPQKRTFKFFYGGDGLGAIQDPRGAETRFTFGSGYLARMAGTVPVADELSDRRVEKVTQRDGRTRAYTYEKATAPSTGLWRTKASNARSAVTQYDTDHRGRTVELTDARGTTTKLRWDGDNNVNQMVEAAGTPDEAETEMGYDENGLLRWIVSPGNDRTNLGYQVGTGVFARTGGEGRVDFVADLNRIESPKGAKTGTPDDFTELYEVDPRGNVTGRRDAEGNWARTQFDSYGQVVKEIDEVGNETRFEQYDPNGMPGVAIDPKGGRSEYQYDAVGNLLATSDPRGARFGGLGDPLKHFQTRFTYDAQDQLIQEVLSKDSTSDTAVASITRSYEYDPNGNALRDVDGTKAAVTRVFDEMDRPTQVTSPPVGHAGEEDAAPEVTRVQYDGEGLVTRQIAPRGEENQASDVDFSTDFEYDANGQLVVERRQQLEGATRTTLITSMAYDRRGNLKGVADAKANATAGVSPLTAAGSDVYRRWRFDYDRSDRRVRAVEKPNDDNPLYHDWAYDPNDNLVTESDANFSDTVHTYDQRDMLVETRDRQYRRTRYERRADGLVTKIRLPRWFNEGGDDDELTERFVYDRLGDVIEHHLPRTHEDPKGLAWKYRRDIVGDPVRITDPRGNAYDNTFLDAGLLKTTTRPGAWRVEGDAIVPKDWSEMGNDAQTPDVPSSEGEGDFGAVTGESDPDMLPKAGKIEATYDDELRLASVIERTPGANNATTSLDRDALGRLTEIKRPLDTAAGRFIRDRLAYDRNGNLVTSTRLNGAGEDWTSRRAYDQFDRLVSSSAPAGSDGTPDVTKYTLDANGLPTAIELPRGDATEYRCYDQFDRLVGVTDPERGFSTTAYDNNGNVVKQTRPNAWAADTAPASCADQPSPTTDNGVDISARWSSEYEYNHEDELTASRDGGTDARKTTIIRDAGGNAQEITGPGAGSTFNGAENARTVRYAYNGRDQVYSTTVFGSDRNRVTITERDGLGNLRRVVKPEGVNAAGDGPAVEDKAPAQTLVEGGDSSDLKAATVQATLMEYSADGLLTAIHQPHDGTENADGTSKDRRYRQSFNLDARGRTESIDAPFEWTKERRLCSTGSLDPAYGDVDRPGCVQRTSYQFLDTGWIKSSTEPSGARPNPDAGQAGQPALLPVGGEDHRYTYDERGLQTSWKVVNREDSVRRTSTREYWPNGLLKSRLADRAGDRKAEDKPREYDYRWSDDGLLTSVIDRGKDIAPQAGSDDRVYRLAYDKLDRLVGTDEDTFEGRAGQDTLFAYDANGNVTERRHNGQLTQGILNGKLQGSGYSGGTTTYFDFDQYDREVRSVVDPANDLKSQIFGTAYFNSDDPQVKREYTYSEASEDAARPPRPAPFQTLRVTDEFRYSTDGRKLGKRRFGATASSDDKTWEYKYSQNGLRTQDETGEHAYNARDQLTKWTRTSGSNVTYQVNGVGDVLKKTDSDATQKSTTNRYALGRLLETVASTGGATPVTAKLRFGYDTAAANVKTINEVPQTNGNDGAPKPLSTFDYDPFDRVIEQVVLKAGQSTQTTTDDDRDIQTFTYDGFDRRDTEKETFDRPSVPDDDKTATYGYIGTSNAVSRRGALHRSNAKTSSYDYSSTLEPLGLSRMGASAAAPDPYRSFAKDVNGSITALTGDTGNNAAVYGYDPYGSAVGTNQLESDTLESSLSEVAQDNPIRFQGFYLDSGVKTYDMRARSYLPSAGRFLTQDRFESASGDFNLASDPLTQSRYAFAAGNPISNVEFDGHKACTATCKPHEDKQIIDPKDGKGGAAQKPTAPAPTAQDKKWASYQDKVYANQMRREREAADAAAKAKASSPPAKVTYMGKDPAKRAKTKKKADGSVWDFAGGASCEFTIVICFGDQSTDLAKAGGFVAMVNPKGLAQKIVKEGGEEVVEQGAKKLAGDHAPRPSQRFVPSTRRERKVITGQVKQFDNAGIPYTEHFAKRMSQRGSRGITPQAALDAYNRGTKFYDSANKSYIRFDRKTGVAVVLRKSPNGPAHTVYQQPNPGASWTQIPYGSGK